MLFSCLMPFLFLFFSKQFIQERKKQRTDRYNEKQKVQMVAEMERKRENRDGETGKKSGRRTVIETDRCTGRLLDKKTEGEERDR